VAVKLSHRQRQARATRSATADAARRLFAAGGYVATTIEGISKAAEIPLQTIYSAFGNKPAILGEIRRLWIAESDVEELHRQALLVPDPEQRLRRAAHWTRRQLELGYEVIAIHIEAARADPRVAEVWRRSLSGREAAVQKLLKSMALNLRPGLSLARALDIYVTATLPEVYRTLVIERGWSAHRYEGWLGDLLVSQIIGAGPIAGIGRGKRARSSRD
jgi:AcrR family transcriptional regulator